MSRTKDHLLEQLEAESDAAVRHWQKTLAEAHGNGVPGIVCVTTGDGEPWYFERHEHDFDSMQSSPVSPPITNIYLNIDDEPSYLEPISLVEMKAAVVQAKVCKPPGSRIMRLAECLPGRRRLRKDIEQVVADMRDEYFAALASGDEREAKHALRRGHLACLEAVFPSWVASLLALISRLIGLA